jgi:hypothetical protein
MGGNFGLLEVAAIIELSWSLLWEEMEQGRLDPTTLHPTHLPRLPKTIDFTVDYLRSGLPRDAYARARVNRSGRRYASVHVEAWQDNRTRLFAQATGHFLMPPRCQDDRRALLGACHVGCIPRYAAWQAEARITWRR